MGVWGVGLYSGDFAMDLRSDIGGVARLPFDGDKLLEILREREASAANSPADEDHTVFWLVVADQFAKRGIACDRVRDKAVAIIDDGCDIAMHAKLGMSLRDQEKRRKMLEEVRARLMAPPSSKPRRVLKKPQPFIMDVGDLLVYPTDAGGYCINACARSKEHDRFWTKPGGWSAMVVVDRGRPFDFLAWYRPLTIKTALAQKPTLAALPSEMSWILRDAATCSPIHFRRMELEKIATLLVDADKLSRVFPGMRPGTTHAISDLSLCNELQVDPHVPPVGARQRHLPISPIRPYSPIPAIQEFLSG